MGMDVDLSTAIDQVPAEQLESMLDAEDQEAEPVEDEAVEEDEEEPEDDEAQEEDEDEEELPEEEDDVEEDAEEDEQPNEDDDMVNAEISAAEAGPDQEEEE